MIIEQKKLNNKPVFEECLMLQKHLELLETNDYRNILAIIKFSVALFVGILIAPVFPY